MPRKSHGGLDARISKFNPFFQEFTNRLCESRGMEHASQNR